MISQPLMNSILRYIKTRVRSLGAKVTGVKAKDIEINFRNEKTFQEEINRIYLIHLRISVLLRRNLLNSLNSIFLLMRIRRF